MLEAVIFDMDGLLVDSEPLWRRAEQAVFPQVGIDLNDDLCRQTMGMRLKEVVRHWHCIHPWAGHSLEQVETDIMDAVIDRVEQEGEPLPGVEYILDFFRQRDFKIALASSSATRLIRAVIGKFGIEDYFDVICSAEQEPHGKPHPAVFLTTADQLGVAPPACLVFEDSFAGLIAGLAARMRTIIVPEPTQYDQSRFDIATLKLRTLHQFDAAALARLQEDTRPAGF